MTSTKIGVAANILEEHWGPVVQKVGTYLMTNGASNLNLIVQGVEEGFVKVKMALAVLIRLHFAAFRKTDRGAVYTASVDNILLVLRYPRYMLCCKQLYGEVAEAMCKRLLMNGEMTMSTLIPEVQKQRQTLAPDVPVSFHSIQEVFYKLIEGRIIHRCPAIESDALDKVPAFQSNEDNKYKIPPTLHASEQRNVSQESELPPAKKQRLEHLDSNIYWQLDFDKLHQRLRDQAFTLAVKNYMGDQAAAVMQLMLSIDATKQVPWAATSLPIYRTELLSRSGKEGNLKCKELDKCLALFKDDSMGFVHKVADGQGGTFEIRMKDMATALASAIVESIVLERFGAKCSRIFGLLIKKKYLEQSQIEQMVMIPQKDTKEMTYRMMNENYIQFQEIPKTPDYAPSRTFYLFHVDLPQVARMVLGNCCKAVFNLKCKQKDVLKRNKWLIEKKQKMDSILLSMQGADPNELKEVEEMITPPEQSQIERYKQICHKLQFSELQLDDTIFILTIYLNFMSRNH